MSHDHDLFNLSMTFKQHLQMHPEGAVVWQASVSVVCLSLRRKKEAAVWEAKGSGEEEEKDLQSIVFFPFSVSFSYNKHCSLLCAL